MKKVFQAIAKAIKAAMRAAFTVARYGVAAVLAPVAAMFGGSQQNDLPEPEITEGPLGLDEIEDEVERDEVRKSRLLHRVQPYASAFEWLCTPPERRQHVDISRLPLPACVWMKRLSDEEARRVRVAGLQAMVDHLTGERPILGVSKPKLPLRDFRDYMSFDDDMPPLERSEKLIAEAEPGQKAARMVMR